MNYFKADIRKKQHLGRRPKKASNSRYTAWDVCRCGKEKKLFTPKIHFQRADITLSPRLLTNNILYTDAKHEKLLKTSFLYFPFFRLQIRENLCDKVTTTKYAGTSYIPCPHIQIFTPAFSECAKGGGVRNLLKLNHTSCQHWRGHPQRQFCTRALKKDAGTGGGKNPSKAPPSLPLFNPPPLILPWKAWGQLLVQPFFWTISLSLSPPSFFRWGGGLWCNNSLSLSLARFPDPSIFFTFYPVPLRSLDQPSEKGECAAAELIWAPKEGKSGIWQKKQQCWENVYKPRLAAWNGFAKKSGRGKGKIFCFFREFSLRPFPFSLQQKR